MQDAESMSPKCLQNFCQQKQKGYRLLIGDQFNILCGQPAMNLLFRLFLKC